MYFNAANAHDLNCSFWLFLIWDIRWENITCHLEYRSEYTLYHRDSVKSDIPVEQCNWNRERQNKTKTQKHKKEPNWIKQTATATTTITTQKFIDCILCKHGEGSE